MLTFFFLASDDVYQAFEWRRTCNKCLLRHRNKCPRSKWGFLTCPWINCLTFICVSNATIELLSFSVSKDFSASENPIKSNPINQSINSPKDDLKKRNRYSYCALSWAIYHPFHPFAICVVSERQLTHRFRPTVGYANWWTLILCEGLHDDGWYVEV